MDSLLDAVGHSVGFTHYPVKIIALLCNQVPQINK